MAGVGFVVFAALLAGCGGSQPPIGASGATPPKTVRTPTEEDYSPTGSLLFVANYTSNSVTVYHADRKKPAPIATISDGLNFPAGDCLDSQGTLYVTNEPASNGGWVAEYPLGKTEPSMVITKGIGFHYCRSRDKPLNVEEYMPGGDHPFKTITKGISTPVAVTVNEKGWLFVANLENSTVVEFPPGSTTRSRRHVRKGLHGPNGLALFPPVLP